MSKQIEYTMEVHTTHEMVVYIDVPDDDDETDHERLIVRYLDEAEERALRDLQYTLWPDFERADLVYAEVVE